MQVTANKVQVMPNGDWVLPFWQEGHNSRVDHVGTASGVLISSDNGRTWADYGTIKVLTPVHGTEL